MRKPLWSLNDDNLFSTASVKEAETRYPLNYNNGFKEHIFKCLWKSVIPKKCKFFIWSILYKGPNTKEVLQKKAPSILSGALCAFQVIRIDTIFLSTFKQQTDHQVIVDDIKSLCHSLCQLKSTKEEYNHIFNLAVAILWNIWFERNNRIFSNKQKSVLNLWKDVCNYLGLWCIRHPIFKDYKPSTIALNFKALLI